MKDISSRFLVSVRKVDPLLAPVLRRDGRVKALFALAGQVRAPAGRGYAHWADTMRREEPGAD